MISTVEKNKRKQNLGDDVGTELWEQEKKGRLIIQ